MQRKRKKNLPEIRYLQQVRRAARAERRGKRVRRRPPTVREVQQTSEDSQRTSRQSDKAATRQATRRLDRRTGSNVGFKTDGTTIHIKDLDKTERHKCCFFFAVRSRVQLVDVVEASSLGRLGRQTARPADQKGSRATTSSNKRGDGNRAAASGQPTVEKFKNTMWLGMAEARHRAAVDAHQSTRTVTVITLSYLLPG